MYVADIVLYPIGERLVYEYVADTCLAIIGWQDRRGGTPTLITRSSLVPKL